MLEIVVDPLVTMHSSDSTVQVTSPLKRLILSLSIDDLALRQDLAAIALAELAHSYEEEIEMAKLESKNRQAWIRAVQAYANQLWLQSTQALVNSDIDLHFNAADELSITVLNTTAMISAARFSQQQVLEQRIIAQFCQQYDCIQLVSTMQAENKVVLNQSMKLSWSFDENGQVLCDNGLGLQLQFLNMKKMAEKRVFCQAFINELRLVLAQLQGLHSKQVNFHWSRFELQSVSGKEGHQLTINQQGDVLWLPLPLSYASVTLFQQSLPWLQAQILQDQKHLILQVGRLPSKHTQKSPLI